MKKKGRQPQKFSGRAFQIVVSGLLLICVVLSTVAASGIYLVKTKVKDSISLMQTIDKEEVKQMINNNLSEETKVKLRDSWTIAIFGLDSRDSNGLSGVNSDVIMLISMNGKTGEVKLASIYRDTCLKTGESKYRKANSAYAFGGPKCAVAMLNENLDLKIDDYIAINWKAAADAINLLGGVDLEITEKEYKYINSFITETVDSTGISSVHLKSAGKNHLDGVQTVAYCRLRLMDDDFARTKRQQKVISLVLEKAVHANYATLNQLIEVVLPQTSSSIDAEDLYAVAVNIMKLQKPEATGFPSNHYCKTVDGSSYVFADSLEENVNLLHEFLYGSRNYTPSKAVKEISHAIHNKAEGTRETPVISHETWASTTIIEETSLEETAPIEETSAEEAASESKYIDAIEIPEPIGHMGQESIDAGEPEKNLDNGPGYESLESKVPGSEVSELNVEEEENYVHME